MDNAADEIAEMRYDSLFLYHIFVSASVNTVIADKPVCTLIQLEPCLISLNLSEVNLIPACLLTEYDRLHFPWNIFWERTDSWISWNINRTIVLHLLP